MLVLLAGIFVVHIATVIMLFVSTIANVWMVGRNYIGNASWGLWMWCNNTCQPLTLSGASLKAAQAFMILSIIFSVIALVTFIVQLFTLEKGKRFYITGAIMLVCCKYTTTSHMSATHGYQGSCQTAKSFQWPTFLIKEKSIEGSGQPDLVGGNLAHSKGVGTTRSLRSLPNQANDSMIMGNVVDS
uniref:Epithelial membrane protein 1 n=1 Tax=Pavo cristatus TaxID=9049 RepID=A0A8C9G7I3_PAVCR